ncbi:MAG: RdgB/HAM1 family non-canonical purine NTP pyrophosphatase [Lachnospiraceae bacterium]|nr:RdgB/HAM1 family non-canonical purine NTP pyrophosphatase [Lachnospiraceae bacterium]MBR3581067.1 RdgB/HAM1 family non-canonical purine NTP pyrophosphatase [Lachnospiraceae bacterium]MBR4541339.1 RdgB/HAM1 family non-canonical purine NTP pyrophosphatase [Lachnospiraceae bacterium]
MQTIIFATGNKGKLREIKEIMEGLPYNIVSMKEAGLETDVDETGTSFEENSVLKARAVAEKAAKTEEYRDALVMADDSGFEVDYLGKEPGIYSARYMGTDTPYSIKNQNILDRMKGVPDEQRAARFVAAIACVFPDGRCEVVRDTFEGKVAYESKGIYGFGYDPIMYVPEKGCNSGELLPEEKNKISHRGKALMEMRKLLEK